MNDLSSNSTALIHRTLIGVVRKKSGNQTVSIVVERITRNKKYHKTIKRRKVYLAHDPQNMYVDAIGARIQIMVCKPISKMKRWVVDYDGSEILKKNVR